MRRRDAFGTLGGATLLSLLPGHPLAEPRRANTLRVAFNASETGFDPLAIGDLNSAQVAACIFEAPLTYDHLARPVKLKPNVAAALPEVSADFTRIRVRIRPGIFFADDPAFGGRPRELVAQDFVYTVKRFYDPKLASENLYVFENAKLLGLSELRQQAIDSQRPFDHDREVDGIRALDRFTFEIRMAAPNPRFVHQLAVDRLFGAMAREVVERYGERIAEHPVGTGPYRLASWRRASLIVLERNPRFREQFFDGEPAEGDAQAQRLAAELAGRRLPLADRIEIHVIDETQPRWLAFLNGALDVLELPAEFAPMALAGDRLAPHLEKRGVRQQRLLQPDMVMAYFNMRDPLVGGYAAEQVALRRAVALAYDGEEDLRLLRRGLGIPAQSTVPPFTSGHDASYRSEMSEHSHARARALLDIYGYLDRDGDGWRERPDGAPLVLHLAGLPTQLDRARHELWRKHMAAVGLRMQFDIASWPELLKRSRANALMMWSFGWSAATPDGGFFLALAYGPNGGESNDARFALPAFDRLFERQAVLPDGPERDALMREAKNLLVAQMPYKVLRHNLLVDLVQPWVIGQWRHPFARDSWRYAGVHS